MSELRSTRSALLMSILALLLCFVMLLGTTFAWFTDSVTSSGNKISSGTLKIDLELLEKDGTWNSIKESNAPIFNYEQWEPGYTDVKILKVENEGTIALKWMAKFISENELSELADVIDVYVLPSASELAYPTDGSLAGYVKVGTVADFVNTIESTTTGVLSAGEVAYLGIALKMDGASVGNDYQGLDLGGAFDITILATQLAGEYPSSVDTWDGTIDISWYDPDETEYSLTSAEAFAGLMALTDGSIPATYSTEGLGTLPVTFEGKTVKLDCDVDLFAVDENGEAVCFDPIGSYRNDQSFKGTFDGQGHVIKNMAQNTWALDNGYYYSDCGLGLFGQLEDATVKNLVLDAASISGESAICGTVAAVAHNTTFENITVINSNVADYQYYAGGLVGWASGEITITNCTIDASTNIAAQWGDFDNSIGGLIGGASTSAEIVVKDTTVACRIDAYNDVTSSYQYYAYRRAGMLIGNSGATEIVDGTTFAAAPQLTCENVEVIYGDWANYTYCEFAGTSWPYVRVQAGVSNSAYSNPRYGHPTDANGNEVVDDNHVHNEGEDHMILCAFDQLYGGGQGVYGKATHDGVTVTYPTN